MDKPSDWIRRRAQELMPEGWGLGTESRPNPDYQETLEPWTQAILDYLDNGVPKDLSKEERTELADQLNVILERLDQ